MQERYFIMLLHRPPEYKSRGLIKHSQVKETVYSNAYVKLFQKILFVNL